MADRRDDPELGGAGDQPVEPAEALEQGAAERVDQLAVGEVERGQGGRRRTARTAGVVDLLERAAGPGDQDELRTLRRAGPGDGGTEAARRPGDEDDAAGEPPAGQLTPLPSSRLSWPPPSSPSRSASRVG